MRGWIGWWGMLVRTIRDMRGWRRTRLYQHAVGVFGAYILERINESRSEMSQICVCASSY
jgi:hypothetical protein